MKPKNKIVIINGIESKIGYRETKGERWSIKNANKDTIKLIDALLINKDSSVKFDIGLTVMNGITTVEATKLDISRPSNHIGIVRKETPEDTVLTYFLKGEARRPKYGVIKSEKNIKVLEDLKVKIIEKLEDKENKSSNKNVFNSRRN